MLVIIIKWFLIGLHGLSLILTPSSIAESVKGKAPKPTGVAATIGMVTAAVNALVIWYLWTH